MTVADARAVRKWLILSNCMSPPIFTEPLSPVNRRTLTSVGMRRCERN